MSFYISFYVYISSFWSQFPHFLPENIPQSNFSCSSFFSSLFRFCDYCKVISLGASFSSSYIFLKKTYQKLRPFSAIFPEKQLNNFHLLPVVHHPNKLFFSVFDFCVQFSSLFRTQHTTCCGYVFWPKPVSGLDFLFTQILTFSLLQTSFSATACHSLIT